MDENFKKNIDLSIQLINKDELFLAQTKVTNLLKTYSNIDIPHNLLGIINLKLKKNTKAKANFKNALKINPKFLSALINLSITYQNLNNYNQAITYLKKAVAIKPTMYELYNDIGFLYKKNKEYSLSIKYFNSAIEINNKYDNAFFNLGLSLKELNKLDEAFKNFIKTIELNPNHSNAYFELGEILRKKEKYVEAVNYYKKSNHKKRNYKILQSFYEEGALKKYLKELEYHTNNNPSDPRISNISAFVSNQLNIKNTYPFCPDPINYVQVSTIKKHKENFNSFIKNLLKEMFDQNFEWEPSGKTTMNGYGTLGNLSDKDLPFLKELEKIILAELKNYFLIYELSNINYISKKPKNFKFVSWSNILKSQGHNIPHIHPSGWVSGVFYLKVPKKIKNDEAGIQFHLNGEDLKIQNINMPKKIISPKVGDIVMFPSCLFHSTVPFTSDEERICIAFDLCKFN